MKSAILSERQGTASGKGLQVRTGVKTGSMSYNRCETLKSKGLKVSIGVQRLT